MENDTRGLLALSHDSFNKSRFEEWRNLQSGISGQLWQWLEPCLKSVCSSPATSGSGKIPNTDPTLKVWTESLAYTLTLLQQTDSEESAQQLNTFLEGYLRTKTPLFHNQTDLFTTVQLLDNFAYGMLASPSTEITTNDSRIPRRWSAKYYQPLETTDRRLDDYVRFSQTHLEEPFSRFHPSGMIGLMADLTELREAWRNEAVQQVGFAPAASP